MPYAEAIAFPACRTFVSEGRFAYALHIQPQYLLTLVERLIGNGPLLINAGSFFLLPEIQ